MAQRVITQLVSDLSGDEVLDGKGEAIDFAYRGKSYTIDLTAKEARGFDRSIAMYVEHATKAINGTGRSGRRASASASGSRSKEETANIRTWAQENGHRVSSRGRVAQSVVDAYHSAQQ